MRCKLTKDLIVAEALECLRALVLPPVQHRRRADACDRGRAGRARLRRAATRSGAAASTRISSRPCAATTSCEPGCSPPATSCVAGERAPPLCRAPLGGEAGERPARSVRPAHRELPDAAPRRCRRRAGCGGSRRDGACGSDSSWASCRGRAARAYASADIFCFPSTTDTFGQVLLEAAASGLPAVAAAAAERSSSFATARRACWCRPTIRLLRGGNP